MPGSLSCSTLQQHTARLPVPSLHEYFAILREVALGASLWIVPLRHRTRFYLYSMGLGRQPERGTHTSEGVIEE